MDADDERRIRALNAKIALIKGEILTDPMRRDVNWYDEEELNRGIRAFPRGTYCNIVSKQTSQITQQYKTHGLPVGESPVDLTAILKWFDSYLTKYGRKFSGKSEVSEKALERMERKETIELEALELRLKNLAADFEKKSGNSIPLDEVDKLFTWFESELRKLGERLGKRFSADAQKLFNDTLDRIKRHLEELLPSP
jgi:hypothetical protein